MSEYEAVEVTEEEEEKPTSQPQHPGAVGGVYASMEGQATVQSVQNDATTVANQAGNAGEIEDPGEAPDFEGPDAPEGWIKQENQYTGEVTWINTNVDKKSAELNLIEENKPELAETTVVKIFNDKGEVVETTDETITIKTKQDTDTISGGYGGQEASQIVYSPEVDNAENKVIAILGEINENTGQKFIDDTGEIITPNKVTTQTEGDTTTFVIDDPKQDAALQKYQTLFNALESRIQKYNDDMKSLSENNAKYPDGTLLATPAVIAESKRLEAEKASIESVQQNGEVEKAWNAFDTIQKANEILLNSFTSSVQQWSGRLNNANEDFSNKSQSFNVVVGSFLDDVGNWSGDFGDALARFKVASIGAAKDFNMWGKEIENYNKELSEWWENAKAFNQQQSDQAVIDNISSQVSSISQSPKTEVFDDMGNVIPTAGRTLSSIERAEKQSSSLTGELGGGGAYQQTQKVTRHTRVDDEGREITSFTLERPSIIRWVPVPQMHGPPTREQWLEQQREEAGEFGILSEGGTGNIPGYTGELARGVDRMQAAGDFDFFDGSIAREMANFTAFSFSGIETIGREDVPDAFSATVAIMAGNVHGVKEWVKTGELDTDKFAPRDFTVPIMGKIGVADEARFFMERGSVGAIAGSIFSEVLIGAAIGGIGKVVPVASLVGRGHRQIKSTISNVPGLRVAAAVPRAAPRLIIGAPLIIAGKAIQKSPEIITRPGNILLKQLETVGMKLGKGYDNVPIPGIKGKYKQEPWERKWTLSDSFISAGKKIAQTDIVDDMGQVVGRQWIGKVSDPLAEQTVRMVKRRRLTPKEYKAHMAETGEDIVTPVGRGRITISGVAENIVGKIPLVKDLFEADVTRRFGRTIVDEVSYVKVKPSKWGVDLKTGTPKDAPGIYGWLQRDIRKTIKDKGKKDADWSKGTKDKSFDDRKPFDWADPEFSSQYRENPLQSAAERDILEKEQLAKEKTKEVADRAQSLSDELENYAKGREEIFTAAETKAYSTSINRSLLEDMLLAQKEAGEITDSQFQKELKAIAERYKKKKKIVEEEAEYYGANISSLPGDESKSFSGNKGQGQHGMQAEAGMAYKLVSEPTTAKNVSDLKHLGDIHANVTDSTKTFVNQSHGGNLGVNVLQQTHQTKNLLKELDRAEVAEKVSNAVGEFQSSFTFPSAMQFGQTRGLAGAKNLYERIPSMEMEQDVNVEQKSTQEQFRQQHNKYLTSLGITPEMLAHIPGGIQRLEEEQDEDYDWKNKPRDWQGPVRPGYKWPFPTATIGDVNQRVWDETDMEFILGSDIEIGSTVDITPDTGTVIDPTPDVGPPWEETVTDMEIVQQQLQEQEVRQQQQQDYQTKTYPIHEFGDYDHRFDRTTRPRRLPKPKLRPRLFLPKKDDHPLTTKKTPTPKMFQKQILNPIGELKIVDKEYMKQIRNSDQHSFHGMLYGGKQDKKGGMSII